ncbi:hypothetical protein KCU71_g59, partial [Aureobasidium melanogenum]
MSGDRKLFFASMAVVILEVRFQSRMTKKHGHNPRRNTSQNGEAMMTSSRPKVSGPNKMALSFCWRMFVHIATCVVEIKVQQFAQRASVESGGGFSSADKVSVEIAVALLSPTNGDRKRSDKDNENVCRAPSNPRAADGSGRQMMAAFESFNDECDSLAMSQLDREATEKERMRHENCSNRGHEGWGDFARVGALRRGEFDHASLPACLQHDESMGTARHCKTAASTRKAQKLLALLPSQVEIALLVALLVMILTRFVHQHHSDKADDHASRDLSSIVACQNFDGLDKSCHLGHLTSTTCLGL